MAKTIVVTNHKGGIGKTSTACAIAAILTDRKYRVLFVDADWQCNSTDTYRAETEDVATVYDLMMRTEGVLATSAIQHTDGGDIIPGDKLISTIEPMLQADPSDGLFRLKEALQSIQDAYDFIILDTNPAASLVLWNCLIAADYVILPLTAARYSLSGLKAINDTITSVQRRQNTSLKVAGVLLVMYDARTKVGKEIKPALKAAANSIGIPAFDTVIRTCADVEAAQSARQSILAYNKKCKATIDYTAFVNELLTVIDKE